MADRSLFDEGSILRQSASLRLMVRALVRDDAEADDVVQETWLTAMKSPGPGFEPAAWLRGIARNVMRTVRRTDRRRSRREVESFTPGNAPSAADDAAKVERLRELLDLVSALREPARQAVILRYFDGLMPREIAERLGIPVATVKARIQTGLRSLREALDQRHGGDRSAWHAAFAGLVPEVLSAGAAATALPALATGGVAMKATAGILGAIVLVALGLWLTWSGAGENAPGRSAERTDGLAEATPDTAANAKAAPSGITPRALPQEEQAPATGPTSAALRVTVVTKGSGAPVAGARVRAWDVSANRADPARRDVILLGVDVYYSPPADAMEAVTDADGVSVFPARPAEVRIIAESAKLWGAGALRSADGAQARVEIEDDVRMDVRVVDGDGAPVAGVPVSLTRFRAGVPPIDFQYGVTAENGMFRALHLQMWLNENTLGRGQESQSLMARLGATLDGGREGVVFDPAALPKEPITLRLPPSGRLTVTVVDGENRSFAAPAYVGVKIHEAPLEVPYGAYVEKDPSDWRRRTFWRPLEGGRAVFPFVALGSKLTVRVHVLDGERELSSSDVDGPTVANPNHEVTVEVGRRLPLLLARLVDEAKQPLRNHSVALSPQSKSTGTNWPWDVEGGVTGADGSLRVALKGPSRIRSGLLGFKAHDRREPNDAIHWYLAVESVPVAPGQDDLVFGDVIMRPVPVLVAGSVRDEKGAPVAGADVLVELRRFDDPRRNFNLPGLQTHTRENGSFGLWEPCDAGDLRVFVGAKGFAKQPPIPFTRGETGLSIVLSRSASLEGSVILPEGVPARELQVMMTGSCIPPTPEGYGSWRSPTDVKSDGSFVVENLRPGLGTLTVAPWGRSGETPQVAFAQVEGIEVAAGVTRDPRAQAIDLRERVCVRTVTVVDSDGAPVAGAEVSFPPPGRPRGSGDAARDTGVDGRAILVTGPDPVSVTIAKEGWLERQVVVSERSAEVTLERGVTLEVAVSSEALPVWPENLRIGLEKEETRRALDSGEAVRQWWERAHAIVEPSGVATIKAPFTGRARLTVVVNRAGAERGESVGDLAIEIKPSPGRQRIEWRIPAEAIRRR